MTLSPSSYQLIHQQDREPDRACKTQTFAEPSHPSKLNADTSPFQARDPPDWYSRDCFPWLDATPAGTLLAGFLLRLRK